MNDAEVIKALECCTKGNTSDVCLACPLRSSDICIEEENGLLKLALDLINRQKAKIEALQMDKSQLQSDVITENLNYEQIKEKWCESRKVIYRQTERFLNTYKELQTAKAEIGELQHEIASCNSEIEQIKAEARKEIFEKLISMCDAPNWRVWQSEIYDLAEKMGVQVDV